MDDFFTGVGGVHRSKAEFISGGADIFTSIPVERATHYSRESVYRPTSKNPDGPFELYLLISIPTRFVLPVIRN